MDHPQLALQVIIKFQVNLYLVIDKLSGLITSSDTCGLMYYYPSPGICLGVTKYEVNKQTRLRSHDKIVLFH